MKKYFLPFFLMVVLFWSCNPDPPDEEDPRDKFVGTWLCQETSDLSYTVNITKDPNNEKRILFYNFHHLGFNEYAFGEVNNNTVIVPFQLVCQGTMNVQGSGGMSNNNSVITLNYIFDDGANKDTVNAVYTKQSS